MQKLMVKEFVIFGKEKSYIEHLISKGMYLISKEIYVCTYNYNNADSVCILHHYI